MLTWHFSLKKKKKKLYYPHTASIIELNLAKPLWHKLEHHQLEKMSRKNQEPTLLQEKPTTNCGVSYECVLDKVT